MRKRAHLDKDGKLNWGWVEMIGLSLTIIAILYSGFGNYAVMANDVQDNAVDIKTNHEKVQEMDEEINDIKLKFAGMEPELQNVKATVTRIEGKLDKVLGLSNQ